jgi:hypothetical protein
MSCSLFIPLRVRLLGAKTRDAGHPPLLTFKLMQEMPKLNLVNKGKGVKLILFGQAGHLTLLVCKQG